MENNFDNFLQSYEKLRAEKIDFCVVTMVNGRGSTPQDIGSRLIISMDKIEYGTIGGGKIEAHCIKIGRELLNDSNEKSHFFTWNLQKDIGMTCGGEVSMFFELYKSSLSWDIVIFGAGHVGVEISHVLSRLNCNLTIIDHREEWLQKVSESSTKVLLESPKDYVSKLKNNSFVLLMTMGHATDLPILIEILKTKKLPYLGVIGSKSKRNIIKKELMQFGLKDEFICPIGLPIGDNAVSEIAISVVSELLQVRDKLKES